MNKKLYIGYDKNIKIKNTINKINKNYYNNYE